MRNIRFDAGAFENYLEWKESDEDVFDKINSLIVEISRDPFKGRGKPEPLKGNFRGCWSRRITQEHRLVYKVEENLICILSCLGHYDD
ncbi:MAG: Txe/YoeB family addiction module toxin [Lewinellaceae bacterium]|nr:Txe/YoeB family addiction module toxin [Lewinellaceae bacterium]